MKRHISRVCLAIGCLLLGACDFDAPVTAGPTRPVESKLLGDWISFDKEDKKPESMSVRKYDDFTYVVSIDHDIYRAFHSDFAKLALLSVQDLNSTDRKYVVYAWNVSDDGQKLTLKRVMTDVISDKAKDTIALQELIDAHAKDPKLLGEALEFTRKPPPSIKSGP